MSAPPPPGPWLHLIGLGADGLASLSPAARAALEAAETIVGGARHHALTAEVAGAERLEWPRPFDAMLEVVTARRPWPTAVLLTGDPLWRSAGAALAAALPAGEWRAHPQLSAYQLAAARVGWALESVATLTVHGRPLSALAPHLAPGARLAILAADRGCPGRVAAFLNARGYGPSEMIVLSDLGASTEARREGTARDWAGAAPSDLATILVACRSEPGVPLIPAGPGLPDAVFRHDGKMTKQEARAVALAKLWPRPGALLWDVGAGAGSIGIEWLRAGGARAIGLEPRAERRAMARANAEALGAAQLELIDASAPEGLSALPRPDAVFIGGGLSRETALAALAALAPAGRLVAHAATLESEALLGALAAEAGGELVRLSVSRAGPMGPYRGWRPMTPVTQWSVAR